MSLIYCPARMPLRFSGPKKTLRNCCGWALARYIAVIAWGVAVEAQSGAKRKDLYSTIAVGLAAWPSAVFQHWSTDRCRLCVRAVPTPSAVVTLRACCRERSKTPNQANPHQSHLWISAFNPSRNIYKSNGYFSTPEGAELIAVAISQGANANAIS